MNSKDGKELEAKRLKFGEITIAELYEKYIPKEYWPEVTNSGIHFKEEATVLFQHLLDHGFDFALRYEKLFPTMKAYLEKNGNIIPENEYEMFFVLCLDLVLKEEPLQKDLQREDFIAFHSLIENRLHEFNLKENKESGNTDKGGRPPDFDINDTQKWLSELSNNPDFLKPNKMPHIRKIYNQIIKLHYEKTGIKPSIDTIKTHRRKLK